MNNQPKKELIIERFYNTPRELVWKAWTNPELVKQWWGPNGVSNTVNDWQAYPGGEIDLVMLAGEELGEMAGQKWPMSGKFEELDEPNKIVFTASAIVNGKPVLTHQTTVTFETTGQQTKMTVQIVVVMVTPEAAGPLAGMEMGWNQQLDKLGKLLTKGI